MLLDTAFLINLINGDADAVAKAQELEANLIQQPAMTLFELYYGVASVAVDDQPWRHGVATAPVSPTTNSRRREH